jgi:hypothetical protein
LIVAAFNINTFKGRIGSLVRNPCANDLTEVNDDKSSFDISTLWCDGTVKVEIAFSVSEMLRTASIK